MFCHNFTSFAGLVMRGEKQKNKQKATFSPLKLPLFSAFCIYHTQIMIISINFECIAFSKAARLCGRVSPLLDMVIPLKKESPLTMRFASLATINVPSMLCTTSAQHHRRTKTRCINSHLSSDIFLLKCSKQLTTSAHTLRQSLMYRRCEPPFCVGI